jgi:hypothetical protein
VREHLSRGRSVGKGEWELELADMENGGWVLGLFGSNSGRLGHRGAVGEEGLWGVPGLAADDQAQCGTG